MISTSATIHIRKYYGKIFKCHTYIHTYIHIYIYIYIYIIDKDKRSGQIKDKGDGTYFSVSLSNKLTAI